MHKLLFCHALIVPRLMRGKRGVWITRSTRSRLHGMIETVERGSLRGGVDIAVLEKRLITERGSNPPLSLSTRHTLLANQFVYALRHNQSWSCAALSAPPPDLVSLHRADRVHSRVLRSRHRRVASNWSHDGRRVLGPRVGRINNGRLAHAACSAAIAREWWRWSWRKHMQQNYESSGKRCALILALVAFAVVMLGLVQLL
jgi:hypothetical protein